MGELKLPGGRLEEKFEDAKPLYDDAEALAEANRCLYCSDAPCIQACPTSIDVPTFIRKIATGNIEGSAQTILAANILGYSCARACPVEVLCVGACVYNQWGREPIAIGRLQRYALETALRKRPRLLAGARKPATGRRVAMVGGGPASIAAAGLLALEGHRCVIFERKAIPGGLDVLGIAPYKLQANDALAEIAWVLGQGEIDLRTGVEVVDGEGSAPGQISARRLLEEFDAVLLGLGLGEDSKLGVPGEQGEGVVGATWMIEKLKSDPGYTLAGIRRALVIGGGNTAIDAARELARIGVPDVAMVYRRSRNEMPGYAHEWEGARLDGVRLIEKRVPVAILRDVNGKLVALQVAEAHEGRAVSSATTDIPADLVVLAIGQAKMTALARAFGGVQLDARGRVVVDPATHRTGNPRVWAAGDCVNGGKEVVNAVGEAKIAARDIDRVLRGAAD